MTKHALVAACLMLGATLAACSQAAPPPGAATVLATGKPQGRPVTISATGRARITAIERSIRSGIATFTIKWVAPGMPSVQIRVSDDGGAQKLFAEGSQPGTATASFVVPGHTYSFALYGSAHAPLATAIVRIRR